MELGALICTPRGPRCDECPLQGRCQAFSLASPEVYPVLPPRRKQVREHRWVAVVRQGDQLLVVRRPEDSRLLAGIWELPWVRMGIDDAAGSAEHALAARYGGEWTIEQPVGRVRHSMTHRAIEAAVCSGQWVATVGTESAGSFGLEIAEPPEGGPLQWVSTTALEGLATTSLVDKALAAFDP